MLKNRHLTAMLALLTMVGALGIDTYLPSFHAITLEFSASALSVQQTLSVYVAAMAITVLFAGTLSDSFGRRPLVLLSLLVFALASLIALGAPDISTLIGARALQGVAAGIGMVLARTMVQDHFKDGEAQRAMAFITMMFGAAPAVAPIIGGWLQATFGWRSVFIFLGIYSVALWAACVWKLPETLPKAQRVPLSLRPIARNYAQVVSHPGFMLRACGIGLVFIGIALHISSASAFIVDILKLEETDFGWLFIPLTLGLILGSLTTRKLALRMPSEQTVALGHAIMVLATLAGVIYALTAEIRIPYAVIPLAIYNFGLAIAMPGMVVATLSLFPATRGLAASMQSFVQMMLFALVSGFVAPHVFHSAQSLALTQLAGLLLGIALWRLASRFPGR